MSFFDSLKKLFGGKQKSVLGIDVGSSAIKIVQLRKERGRAVLETYGEIALGPYIQKSVGQAVQVPNDVIVTALGDLMKESKATTKNTGVAVPLSASLISLIEVPALSPDKLEKLIPIEARKYIPVPVSEVLLDWYSLPKNPNDEKDAAHSEVLIVAIHKERVGQYQQIVADSKLETTFFEIEAFSTTRAVLDRGIQPKLVIDMGASSTKIYIVEAGIIKESHVVNRGSQDITQAIAQSQNISFEEAEQKKRQGGEGVTSYIESTLTYVFSEVRRIVLQYQSKHNVSVVEAFLSGGGSLAQGVVALAEERLDATVTVSDPFAKVEAPAFLADVLKEAGPEFAVAIGLALRKLEELN